MKARSPISSWAATGSSFSSSVMSSLSESIWVRAWSIMDFSRMRAHWPSKHRRPFWEW
jgi:hypothetical protein